MIDDFELTSDEYLALYERFLSRPVDDLLLVAGPIEGKRVLDLCCGTMRAANRAKELGANWVIGLDKSRSIIPTQHKADQVIYADMNELYKLKVGPLHNNLFVNKVDLIVCQQAINYWFSKKNIENVSLLLKDKGSFVFNTFNTRPSDEPVIKRYGETVEAVQCVDGIVCHLQMRKGYTPHFTTFEWLEAKDISSVLTNYFNVKSIIDGATTIYICER